tara:strand:- start:823 stop:1167 length:345 start_codon:yes stop_codon:yes gene_type:complete
MSKLLRGRLPFAPPNTTVDGETFNRAVRLLELSLGAFDPSSTPQFNRTDRDQLKFNSGDVIWNTSVELLQVYDGDEWFDLSRELPYTRDSLEAEGQVGAVQIINKGAIVVSVHG